VVGAAAVVAAAEERGEALRADDRYGLLRRMMASAQHADAELPALVVAPAPRLAALGQAATVPVAGGDHAEAKVQLARVDRRRKVVTGQVGAPCLAGLVSPPAPGGFAREPAGVVHSSRYGLHPQDDAEFRLAGYRIPFDRDRELAIDRPARSQKAGFVHGGRGPCITVVAGSDLGDLPAERAVEKLLAILAVKPHGVLERLADDELCVVRVDLDPVDPLRQDLHRHGGRHSARGRRNLRLAGLDPEELAVFVDGCDLRVGAAPLHRALDG